MFCCRCLKCSDYNNDYYIQIICLINFIQNIIYLGAFLLFSTEYKPFSYRIIISPLCFLISCGVAGLIFLITKIMQYKKKDNHFHNCDAGLFMFGLTFFKVIFYLGIWTLFKEYNWFRKKFGYFIYEDDFFNSIAKVYAVYFSFSILYYLSIYFYILKNKSVNNISFIIISIIYTGIATLIFHLIKGKLPYIYWLIIACFFESITFNLGFGLAYCRELEKNNPFWNVLHIEIYKFYPIYFPCALAMSIILLVIGIIIAIISSCCL